MRGTLSTTRGRRNVSRRLLGALAVALALSGVALARGDIRKRSPHALKGPAIHLTAPSSVTASSLYPIKVSGYFNNRTSSARYPGANVAFVAGTDHSVHCNLKALTNPRLGFMQVAGGPSDRKLRASKPRHFSTKEEVRAPTTRGDYTLCAYYLNYPYGYRFVPMATAHLTVQAGLPGTLTVSLTGSGAGAGEVQDDSGLIDCGDGHTMCSHAFPAGTTVSLTALSDNEAGFIRWSGACSGSYPDCNVPISGSQTVTAVFEKVNEP